MSRLLQTYPHEPSLPNLPPSPDCSNVTPISSMLPTYRHQQAHHHDYQLEVHGCMMLLKTHTPVYIVLTVGLSAEGKGRAPANCIYICTNNCNCSKNEHTFLTLQSLQLNCLLYLPALTRCKCASARWPVSHAERIVI
jgi:hypothetical protein